MSSVLRFNHVTKKYRIGQPDRSLRGLLTRFRLSRAGSPANANSNTDSLLAMNDVNFEVRKGDILGVVGHNGAGKTTLLKLLSRVTYPTSGEITVDGRVSALIELGAGFHPDLTGRENIYLNGVILGLTRQEMRRKFQHIVEFAELEKFIDTPVKRYSSGMYARLGFSVAAHADPDVFLIDEVLGVGDMAFQKKCYNFLHSFVSQGRTAVFVSHNVYVIEQLCNRLLWLDAGQVRMYGTPRDVLPRYFDSMESNLLRTQATTAPDDDVVRIVSVAIVDDVGQERDTFSPGESVSVEITYDAKRSVERPHFCVAVLGTGSNQSLFAANMLIDGEAPPTIEGTGAIRCRFESVPLMPRTYEVWGEVWGSDGAEVLVRWQMIAAFRVVDGETVKTSNTPVSAISRMRIGAPIRVDYQWQY